MDIPQGDLARAVVHEPNRSWPTMIEILSKKVQIRLPPPADRVVRTGLSGKGVSSKELWASATRSEVLGRIKILSILSRLNS